MKLLFNSELTKIILEFELLSNPATLKGNME